MLAVTSIINNRIQGFISFFNISNSYFKKRNPVMTTISNIMKSVYIFLTSGKRLKMLKYQAQLARYRMHQMEKLIDENNSANSFGGNIINKYR